MVNGPRRKRAFQLIDSIGNIGETGKEEYTVVSLANSAVSRFLEVSCLASGMPNAKGLPPAPNPLPSIASRPYSQKKSLPIPMLEEKRSLFYLN